MHDVALMGSRQGAAQIVADARDERRRERSHALHAPLEVLAFEILHHQIEQPVVRAALVHLDDARMRDAGRNARLALKPLDQLSVARVRGQQQLERGLAREMFVEHRVHDADAAAAEQTLDTITIGHHVARWEIADLGRMSSIRLGLLHADANTQVGRHVHLLRSRAELGR